MDTSTHNLRGLFEQLGLPGDQDSVTAFIEEHAPLSNGTNLSDAPFLNESQRDFIRQQWELDSDWCEAIDELDALLRH
ncbi:hypothetical protein BTA51_06415 [Hahella sp. CCB-MM4]|uniref:DUF2789 domain-containing protein n=1 Tax=Hahella sp. (strain CCB-MM4) TaxID=1926491 RepID=UPI000B9C4538|nr:DUF2789 domain-containing protein [Hahella sp. CCB-MM4]OZG74622.1 hypothetical protein BTA51_06415 [Hahella sp. CCB-MM4]